MVAALLVLLAVFVLLIGAPVAMSIAWRAQKMLSGEAVPNAGWINRAAHCWYRASQRARAKNGNEDAADAQRRIAHEREFNAMRAALARKPSRLAHTKGPSFRPPTPAIDADPCAPRDASGRTAHFRYIDRDGVVTERKVKNWHSDDTYLEGQCSTRKAHRIFRLDRIEEWYS